MSNRSGGRYLDARRRALITTRAARKRLLIERCSMQAKVRKAMDIVNLRGSNGMSMNAALLQAHGLKGKEAQP